MPRREDPTAWREHLSTRLARALTLLYLAGTVVVLTTMHGHWEGTTMTALGCMCLVLAGIPALTGQPKGRELAWLIVSPLVITSLTAYALVGFLSGPSTVLTLTLMLAGLLLGKRAMLALSAIAGVGLSIIALAMVNAWIPQPNAQDISVMHAGSWLRTIALTFLAIGLLGSMMIELVERMERSLAQAQAETRLREQAEKDKAQTEVTSLQAKQLETIGRLAAGVAHDFNNNLTAIIGCAELLKEECSNNRSAAELAEDILMSSRRAAELTGQLLAYSRKAPMELVTTDIHRVLKGAVNLLRRSIDPRVKIVTELQAENSEILADATLLENALLNLLVNASDAMPDGGRLTIATVTYNVVEGSADRLRGLSPGMHILIEVLDTGFGIDSEILPKIFDPFFTTKPVGKGTGLGLAAVFGTVQAHSGSIEVESEPDCGTAFRIILPCVKSEPVRFKRESTSLVKGSGEILLVDDDLAVSRAVIATLQSLGYGVTPAADGNIALELLEASPQRFGLVLLDLRMPNMSGEATFDALRNLAPRLPILIWSGCGAQPEVASMLERGAAGFIQKPYRIAELSRIVHQAIQSGLNRKLAEKIA